MEETSEELPIFSIGLDLLGPDHNYIFRKRKVDFKILPNTMSVFHGVKNDLSGDPCKSGPGHFASEKSFHSNFAQ